MALWIGAFFIPMIDVWQRLRSALSMVIMLPSFVQAVLPSLSPTKHIHDVVTMVYERSLDDFLQEVKRLFEAPLDPANLLMLSGQLQEQFQKRLQASDICMLPSYNHTLPTGHERGTYLALDVGGSTFRVALVDLGRTAAKSMEIKTMQCHQIGNSVRLLEGHDFFDWMAARICETLDGYDREAAHGSEPLRMGLSWSFPIEYVESSIMSKIRAHSVSGKPRFEVALFCKWARVSARLKVFKEAISAIL